MARSTDARGGPYGCHAQYGACGRPDRTAGDRTVAGRIHEDPAGDGAESVPRREDLASHGARRESHPGAAKSRRRIGLLGLRASERRRVLILAIRLAELMAEVEEAMREELRSME